MATYGFSGLSSISSGKSIDTSARRLIFSGRVKDIILNSEHPRFNEFDYSGIGVIFWDDIATPSRGDLTTGYAYPLFPNQKHYPLLNEVVSVIKLPSFLSGDEYPTTVTENYYFSPTNIWGEVNHNAIPLPIPQPENQARSYQQTQVGAVSTVSDESDSVKLGNTFIEKDNIRGLQPYEGDHILEGRWGNSIRFGSTVKNGFPSNNWSEGDNNFEGDPLTIIRNGQSFPQGDFNPILEKIQTDPSSIYLTSTQKLDFLQSSDLKDSFNPEDQEVTPVITNQYEGNSQIVLNSGRLVLNSNSDSVLISSPQVIHLSANKQIHLDSVDKTIISTSKLFLGDRNATERVVKGDTLVLELQKLVIALEGLSKACTTAAAGPFPVPSLIAIGPVLEAAVKDFKGSLAGQDPKILSKDVKTK